MQPIFQEHICLTDKELKAYHNGELEQKVRFRVENHLLDCPLCSDALDGFSLAHTQAPQKIKTFNPKFRWLRAAAAVVIVVACLVSLRIFLNSSDQKLYTAFFESYPNEMDERVRSSGEKEGEPSISQNLLAAFTAYDEKRFDESIALFSKEMDSREYGDIVRFYGGIAALEAGNTPKAKQLLESASLKGSTYEAEAKWYLALALIQEGKRDDAIELLDVLAADKTSRYNEKAITLRSKF